jgi:hypothetical protein
VPVAGLVCDTYTKALVFQRLEACSAQCLGSICDYTFVGRRTFLVEQADGALPIYDTHMSWRCVVRVLDPVRINLLLKKMEDLQEVEEL